MEQILVDQKITRYKATDGSVFMTAEDCKKYEDTLECIINAKYNKILVKSTNEFDLFGIGNSDVNLDIVNIGDEKDKEIIVQMESLNWSKIDDYIKNRVKTIISRLVVGKYNIIDRGYDYDSAMPIGTIDQIIDNIKERWENVLNSGKKEQEK